VEQALRCDLELDWRISSVCESGLEEAGRGKVCAGGVTEGLSRDRGVVPFG
jgi:hypothetical protein